MVKRLALVLVAIFLLCGVGESADGDALRAMSNAEFIKFVRNMSIQQGEPSVKGTPSMGKVFNKIFKKGTWEAHDLKPSDSFRMASFRGFLKDGQGLMQSHMIAVSYHFSKDLWTLSYMGGQRYLPYLPTWLEYEFMP